MHKFSCFAMILFAVAVSSCNKDDNGDGDDNGNFPGAFDGKIEGTLASSLISQVDSVMAYIDWDNQTGQPAEPKAIASVKDGKFSLTLPTPKSTQLSSLSGEDGAELMEITPSDAKVAVIYGIWTVKNGRYDDYLVLKSGNTEVYFWYLDKDAHASGTFHTEEHTNDEDYSATISVDMNLKKGWNIVLSTQTSETEGRYTTGSIPSGAVWTKD